MVDQVLAFDVTTPSVGAGVGATVDIADAGITEPARAAIVFYSATTSDDSDVTSARVGVTLISSESTNHGSSQCVLARDGLAAPDCRTARGGDFLIVPRVSAFVTQFDFRCAWVGAISGGFRLDTIIDPLVQTKAAALVFAGTGMRSWLAAITATTTLQNGNAGPTSPSDTRFRPHLLILLAPGGVATSGQDPDAAAMMLGFVVDDGTPTQVCTFTNWADATEPSDTDGEVLSAHGAAALDSSRTRHRVTFGFTSTGYTYQADAGTQNLTVLAIRFEAATPSLHVGQHELDGSSPQEFALPFDPEVVVGMSTLLDALDTPDGTSQAGAFGLFMFSDAFARAYSARFKQGESTTSDASTRQGDHAVLTLDHVGAVAQQYARTGTASPHGFELTGSSTSPGYLTLLALSTVNVVEVDPVELELVLPAVQFAALRTPDPVALPLVVPAPLIVPAKQPTAVVLALELPDATVIAPPPPHVFVPLDLGPLYAQSLASLLPRGLAWNRRATP